MTDEEVSAIHPEHNVDSIKSLLPRLHYFQVRCFKKQRKNLEFTLFTIGCAAFIWFSCIHHFGMLVWCE